MTSDWAGSAPERPTRSVPLSSSTSLGGGASYWNVMRLYPEATLGVVMMGNTTGYDHKSILDEAARLAWE